MKKLTLIVSAVLLLTSCSQDLFNFTIVSTKNIEIEKLSMFKKGSNKVKGEDIAYIIILIPTKRVKIDQAISNTMDGIPGCVALLDGTVISKFWFIPYIYGQAKIVVEATPLIDKSITETSNLLPKYGKVTLDKDGKFKSIIALTEIEYMSEKNGLMSGLAN